jgi:T5SS/PEP-CTERM-associated repeat protein
VALNGYDRVVVNATNVTDFDSLGSILSQTPAPYVYESPNFYYAVQDEDFYVQSGGQASFTLSEAGFDALIIGVGPSLTQAGTLPYAGTMTVTGTGSEVSANAEVDVGENQDGSLSVLSGASFTITIADPSDTDAAVLGVDQNVTGDLIVFGAGSTFSAGSTVDVGYLGTGTVTIQNGGQAQVGSMDIGRLFGSDGTVTVTGSGSLLTTTVDPAFLYVGDAGSGTLMIAGSAGVTVGGDLGVGNGGGTGTVTVDTNGSLTVSGNADIGDNDGAATVTIEGGGTLTVSGTATVADDGGTGTLMVEGGGTASFESTLSIGLSNDSTGDVTVTGSGSTLTDDDFVEIGEAATGTLTVENEGVVSIDSSLNIGTTDTGSGTVTVTGADSKLTVGTFLAVGPDGTASLTVENGASVSVTSSMTVGEGHLSDDPDSNDNTGNDSVTVTGPDSDLMVGDFVRIGDYAQGMLTIDQSATATFDTSLDIGLSAGGTGTVTVDNDATLGIDDFATVGTDGTGTLNIQGAGTVTVGTSMTIGDGHQSSDPSANDNTGDGTVAVTDVGSMLTVADFARIGGYASGTLTVEAGAAASFEATLDIGFSTGGQGTVTVEGADPGADPIAPSTLEVADDLTVGEFGDGTLSVESGASVTAESSVTVGGEAGGSGTVAVSGAYSTVDGDGNTVTAASELQVATSLTVGDAGDGTLTVEDGGDISAESMQVGNSAGGTGNVTVTDQGSDLTVDGGADGSSLVIGGGGTGTVMVEDGAQLTASSSAAARLTVAAVSVGDGAGGNGTLDVTGSGSTVTVDAGGMFVGLDGTGTLDIADGGSLSVTDDAINGLVIGVNADGTGSVSVTGASLSVTGLPLVVGNSGVGSLDVEDGATVTATTLAVALQTASAASTVTVDGDTTTLDVVGQAFIGDIGSGTMTVSDSAIASIGSKLTIGNAGTGTLTVESSGSVVGHGAVAIGELDGSTGTVTVTDAAGPAPTPSSLTYGVTLVVGDDGTGTLTINQGATVSPTNGTGTIEIGAQGGSGTVAVDGSGSQLAGTDLYVGGTQALAGGKATMALSNAGVVFAADAATVWGKGTVTLQGGTLASPALTIKSGGVIYGFGTISGAPDGSVAGAMTNDGIVTAENGTLDISNDVTSDATGQFNIAADATLEFSGTVDANETIKFVPGGNAVLVLDPPGADGANFNAALDDFGAGDFIDIDQFAATSASFQNGVYTLSDGGTQVLLDFGTGQTAGTLSYSISGGSTIVQTTAPCFCGGTLILTDRCEVPVEDLRIGDNVVTSAGTTRKIKWIGRRSYSGRFVMGRRDILPIRIKAGALRDGVPRRDLWISPHHAMYLEGVLIEAKDLVNSATIAQAERVERVEYFHIELDTHDVIIAEGALSESFLDDDSRGMFHNAHEYWALYPDASCGPPRYCAPRLDAGYEVEAVRRRIDARAGLRPMDKAQPPALRGFVDVVGPRRIEGWAQNLEYPEAPVCLDILAGGRLIGQVSANRYREDLERAGLGGGRHGFAFTLPAGLTLEPWAVEVRRALDGAVLGPSTNLLRILESRTRRAAGYSC